MACINMDLLVAVGLLLVVDLLVDIPINLLVDLPATVGFHKGQRGDTKRKQTKLLDLDLSQRPAVDADAFDEEDGQQRQEEEEDDDDDMMTTVSYSKRPGPNCGGWATYAISSFINYSTTLALLILETCCFTVSNSSSIKASSFEHARVVGCSIPGISSNPEDAFW
jgi:hypothetical protein